MFQWCVRDGWRRGQTAILTQLLLLTIIRCVIFKDQLSTSSASWLGFFNRGSLRATSISGAFSVCKLAGLLVTHWLNCRRHLPIIFHNALLLSLLLPLIYTGASLIDGSVKGQYITLALVQVLTVTVHIWKNSQISARWSYHCHFPKFTCTSQVTV